jgi:hypothetical protein
MCTEHSLAQFRGKQHTRLMEHQALDFHFLFPVALEFV